VTVKQMLAEEHLLTVIRPRYVVQMKRNRKQGIGCLWTEVWFLKTSDYHVISLLHVFINSSTRSRDVIESELICLCVDL
jgi:hypothetical protein